MENFKGTPGPWYRVKVEKTEYMSERNEICYGDDGECVAEFVENDYDSVLIAHAPEMLEAMQEFCERVERGEVHSRKTYAKFKDILTRATTI